MIKGVIFDLGETLIGFQGDWDEVFAQSRAALIDSLHEQGVAVDREDFSQAIQEEIERAHAAREEDYIERPTIELVRDTLEDFGFGQVERGAVQRAVGRMYSISQQHWHPLEGAVETVAELAQRGYRLGMISNASDVADVHHLVDKLGIRSRLDPILVSAGVGVRKPAAEIFERVLELWDLPPQAAVMVGDTLNADILGAQTVGMHNIWLRTAQDRDDNVAWRGEIEPEIAVDEIQQVPAEIETLARKTQDA